VKTACLLAFVAACHAHGPPAPSCEAAADHVFALVEPKDERAHKIRDAFARRCKDDHWHGDVLSCIADEPALTSGRHCLDKLDSSQRSSLSHDLAEADKPGVPKECDAYKAAVDKATKCDKIPVPTRDQILQYYKSQAAQWKNLTREDVGGIKVTCDQAAESIKQLSGSVGC
jgi:hypothetical protein